MKIRFIWLMLIFALPLMGVCSDWDEFKIKRENDFSFTKVPVVQRLSKDSVTVSFAVASNCDVTIVVENTVTKKIIRHLASGVLGSNAPKPFQKNKKSQSIEWDLKDDKGKYVKDLGNISIRVSLGLKPQYEKQFYHSPEQRFGLSVHRTINTPEGVYVYDGGDNWDFLRLFNHDGLFLKTIYPLSASVLKNTKGLEYKKHPSGEGSFPWKVNFMQNSFLKYGTNYGSDKEVKLEQGTKHYGMYGKGASFLAVSKNKVALGMAIPHIIGLKKTSDLFYGPLVAEKVKYKGKEMVVSPKSAAFSPDGKKVYFTGYHFCQFAPTATRNLKYNGNWATLNMVKVLDIETRTVTIFKGNNQIDKSGSDQNSFSVPIYVTTDDMGRVYVADFYNDRVQVFDQKGSYLKSISSKRPTYVSVLNQSKSVVIATFGLEANKSKIQNKGKKKTIINVYKSFESPKLLSTYELPKYFTTSPGVYIYSGDGIKVSLNVNDDAGELRAWASIEKQAVNRLTNNKVYKDNLKIYQLRNNKTKLIKDFEDPALKDLAFTKVNQYGRQRIYVNPKTENLFLPISMYGYVGKAFKNILEINSKTGKIKKHKTFFDAEDMAFDIDGHIYLKSKTVLARFNLETWREIPFDYGIETKAFTSSNSDRVVGKLVSGVRLPFSDWHHGGMYVTPKGFIALSGPHDIKAASKKNDAFQMFRGRAKYTKMNHLVHIFDKYGKPYRLDLLRGLTDNYGIGLDDDFNYYVMSGGTRLLDGKSYRNQWSGTLMKFPFKSSKIISDSRKAPVAITKKNLPKRSADVIVGGTRYWADDAQWFYGGVGFAGKNSGNGCACFNAKMAFDYLHRSFVPELERFSVAVLDSSGNLICRIGQYGNSDSQGPKSKEPLGGDEVGLMHGAYLATLTDRKLYIADQGNSRIVSVNLNYHVNKIMSIPTK